MGSKVVLTYADYAALPDDGRRYELYEGEIEMIPAPTTRHQLVLGNLPHYWLVDPDTQTLEAYQLEESGYRLAGTLRGPGAFTSPLLPGLSLSGSALWP